MHWWSQQACDAAAEAQAADPSPANLMAAAQVQAMVSMAEALHRIAAALEEQNGSEAAPPMSSPPPWPVRTARHPGETPERHSAARTR